MLPTDGVGDEPDKHLSVGDVPDTLLDELTRALWNYRSGMERVEFLLEAQLLFAGAGRDERMSIIADLMDETATALGSLALQREIMLRAGWKQAPTLEQLAHWSDDPWSTILRDHSEWLTASLDRVRALLDQCRLTRGSTEQLTDQLAELVAESSGSTSDVDPPSSNWAA